MRVLLVVFIVFVGCSHTSSTRVTVIGDSQTAAAGGTVGAALHAAGYDVGARTTVGKYRWPSWAHVHGHGGCGWVQPCPDTTHPVGTYISEIRADRPDVVVMLLGLNDTRPVRAAVEQVVRAFPKVRFVLLTYPRSVPGLADRLPPVTVALHQVAEERENVEVADLASYFTTRVRWPADYLPDRYHFGPAAWKAYATFVAAHV